MPDWEHGSADLSSLDRPPSTPLASPCDRVTTHSGSGTRWAAETFPSSPRLSSFGYLAGTGYASTMLLTPAGQAGQEWARYGDTTPGAWRYAKSADVAAAAHQGTNLTLLRVSVGDSATSH